MYSGEKIITITVITMLENDKKKIRAIEHEINAFACGVFSIA